MNIEDRYLSKSGNTEKIAKAIAEEIGVAAEPITKVISKETDILFLGGAVYYSGIDSKLKDFIASLDNNNVKEVVVFSTAAVIASGYSQMKKLLKKKGIKVSDKEFHCRGEFLMSHKGRPNEDDIKSAKKFARSFK
jgi:flavodoxin